MPSAPPALPAPRPAHVGGGCVCIAVPEVGFSVRATPRSCRWLNGLPKSGKHTVRVTLRWRCSGRRRAGPAPRPSAIVGER
jgi:hypothetical protein